MYAINLATGAEVHFDKATTPEWAVAYGFCEENSKLSWLFHSCRENDGEWQKLPFVYGKTSVSLGDWAAKRIENDNH